ncbi:sigma-54-dependent transcriptional regulator [Crassaminicella profunda]|uniref:sigma-54-dependent transcriptional regulator n=1 Tax=Crassaminicella profunda TaxID=1286698 RepID=UPI001CA69821|nr:sigma-54 dependent transcriptional regulator [Crassaminicella profunda]QZY54222.1 sigma-54 dependent transcriptional regulator [Crassaminicella profunda]
MRKFKILIVDDEEAYQDVFKMILEEKGYDTDVADSGFEALKKLEKDSFDVVLTDLMMEGMNGTVLLEKIKEKYPELAVILVTGYASVESAVSAMKKGAFSYFIKSHDPETLLIEIEKLRKLYRLENDNKIFRNNQMSGNCLLRTNNNRFQKLLDIAKKAANSHVNILIMGESGVGKEVLARYIHQCSNRKDGHFVAVNCQALSEGLLESELFGHEKGAFTGAIERRIGRFEEAHGGTLFLDEIGEMPISTQVKLLRTLETKCIERIGSNKAIQVDLRVISATNRDIPMAVAKGVFREDLFYRINTILLEIPPLRQRREDLSILIDFFFEKSKNDLKKRIVKIEKGVTDFLLSYDYPGNVREMKNIVERLVVLSENGIIRTRDLPENRRVYLCDELEDIRPLKEIKKEVEARYIEKALEKCDKNITETARQLQISRRQLFNKIVEYELK